MDCCKRYRVSGRVQGVAFRASACHEATRLGVTGWVRNLANGDVEALVCGSDAQLQAFETWLQRGPPAARVDSVHATAEDNAGFASFEIR